MSVASRASANSLLAGLKDEIDKLVWAGYEDVKTQTVSVKISVFRIPITVNLELSKLKQVIELLTGTAEPDAP